MRASDERGGSTALLLLLALATAVRLGAWWLTAATPIFNDEVFYYIGPLQWLQGNQPFDLTRPPATALFNAAVMELAGVSPSNVRAAGALLGCIVVALVYPIARQIGGRRIALTATATAALYPTLVGYSHYLYSETLFLVFTLAALWLVLRQTRKVSLLEVAAAGSLCGLSALTRDVGIALTAALALALALCANARLPRRAAATLLLVVAAAVVVAPWSIHLRLSGARGGLVSQTTWLNLYLGNPAPGKRATMPQYLAFGDSFEERLPEARRRAIAAIRQRMPMWPVEKLENLVPLFQPTSFPVKRLLAPAGQRRGGVGVWRYSIRWPPLDSPQARRLMALLTATSYIAVALLGFAGLLLVGRGRQVAVLYLVVASIVAPVILTFPMTRFRLPIEPILIVGTAVILGGGRRVWASASQWRRLAAALSVAAMAALLWAGANAFMSPTRF